MEVVRYGRLEGLRAGDAPLLRDGPLPSIVVVLGPNESGKSTFFSLLTTLLYGFRPATADKHPYAPWHGGQPEAKARIRLDAGDELEVHRRLLASGGWGQMTVAGRTDDLRNQPAQFAGHVSRAVFRQVYAISLPDLAALESESWERVQDRLTGAMGAADLRPARVVAAEFHSAATALWRPDQRGKPLARELSAELRELQDRRRRALDSDRELRGLVGQKAEADEHLAAVLGEHERHGERRQVLERRLNHLRPVVRKRARIAELRERAGDDGVLDGVPPDPAGRLAEFGRKQREAEERLAECDAKTMGAQDRIRTYADRHQRIAEAAGQLQEAARQIVELPELEENEAKAKQEARDAARLCEERARAVFSSPWDEWDEATVGALRALPAAEFGSRVAAYRSLVQRRQSAAEALDGELVGLQDAERPGWWRLVAGVPTTLGAAAVFSILYFPDTVPPWAAFLTRLDGEIALVVSAVLVFVGAILIATWVQDRLRANGREKDSAAVMRRGASRIEGAEEEAEAARRKVAELVASLPVLPRLLEEPEAGLAAAVEKVAEAADALAERERALEERRERVVEARRQITQALDAAGMEPPRVTEAGEPSDRDPPEADASEAPAPASEASAPDSDADTRTGEPETPAEAPAPRSDEGAHPSARRSATPSPAPRLDEGALLRRLDEAVRARKDAAAAQRELDRAEGERSTAVEDRDAAAAALRELNARLSALGDGDPSRGAEAAAAMLDARDRADRLEEELLLEHPELDQVLAEVRQAEADGVRWDELNEALATHDERLRGLGEEVQQLQREAAGLATKVEHAAQAETADQVGGRIGEVEERIRDAKRRRDRAFLLARLVEEADRRFREKHQPELLRRAGEHLRSVTGGRYDQIGLADGGSGSFQLSGPADVVPRDVEGSVSQGTREQVYLALRLAIVDHLDAGEETLPLFMDEVLVNWDAVRRDRALDLLERVSKTRQIFFFTCHPAMAAELEDRGGTILPLER